MRHSDSPLVIPPFQTFRRLPVFASLLALADTDTSKSIQDILGKKGVKGVVRTELKKWENEAREALETILGSDPESGSKDETHPVDHWTTWFLCKQCTDRAVQYKTQIEPLSFQDACQHECFVPKGQKRKTNPWDASTFTKDEKAGISHPSELSFANMIRRRLPFRANVLIISSPLIRPPPC